MAGAKVDPEWEGVETPMEADSRHPGEEAGPLTLGVSGASGLDFPSLFFPSQIPRQEGDLAVGPRRTAQPWESRAARPGRVGADRAPRAAGPPTV